MVAANSAKCTCCVHRKKQKKSKIWLNLHSNYLFSTLMFPPFTRLPDEPILSLASRCSSKSSPIPGTHPSHWLTHWSLHSLILSITWSHCCINRQSSILQKYIIFPSNSSSLTLCRVIILLTPVWWLMNTSPPQTRFHLTFILCRMIIQNTCLLFVDAAVFLKSLTYSVPFFSKASTISMLFKIRCFSF